MEEKTMKEIRERQEKERNDFQDKCPHTNSRWMDYMWAPGHFGLPVRACDVCEKILEHTKMFDSDDVINTNNDIEL